MADFKGRIIRAAKLDVHLYEEVEADPGATTQALGVVVLSSVAAGIGTVSQVGPPGILVGTVAALISWYLWAWLAYLIGTKLLPEPQTHADVGQLLRTIGFASAPGLIRVLGIIPGLARLLFPVAGIWMLLAMVIAIRQALDYSKTIRAVAVCVLGWLAQILVFLALFLLVGGPRG